MVFLRWLLLISAWVWASLTTSFLFRAGDLALVIGLAQIGLILGLSWVALAGEEALEFRLGVAGASGAILLHLTLTAIAVLTIEAAVLGCILPLLLLAAVGAKWLELRKIPSP